MSKFNVQPIREPDTVCMNCGKVFVIDDAFLCPRCMSENHREFNPSQHEEITITVPKGWDENPLEETAKKLFDRVERLTGWREPKVRLWFELANPLLGNVSPEWMILNGKAERLEKFIKDAEFFSTECKQISTE
jgi:hypothetical protein